MIPVSSVTALVLHDELTADDLKPRAQVAPNGTLIGSVACGPYSIQSSSPDALRWLADAAFEAARRLQALYAAEESAA